MMDAMRASSAHRPHLEEGGGDGQVRVVPEAHGEDGVYLLSLLDRTLLAIELHCMAQFALMQASSG